MLSDTEQQLVKNLYVEQNKTVNEILNILSNPNVTDSMVRHFIRNNKLNRRTNAPDLTEEQKRKILELNAENKNCKEIENVIGIDRKRINAFLRRNNLNSSLSVYKKISKRDIEEICNMYQVGLTAREILDKRRDLQLCENTICKIVRDAGYTVRATGMQPRKINEDFFETIDSEEKAYFLGWMLSDGYVIYPKNRSPVVRIDLNQKDRYILEEFNFLVSGDRETGILNQKRYPSQANIRKKETYQSRVSFTSKKMVSDLAKYGVVPRKCKTITLPLIDDNLMPHLIRGLFDGDGCISGRMIGFSGNNQMMKDIQSFLIKKIHINDTKIHYNGCAHSFTFSSKKDVSNFYNFIYNDAHYFLKRKKERFEKLPYIQHNI